MNRREIHPANTDEIDGWMVKTYHLLVDDAVIDDVMGKSAVLASESLLPRAQVCPPIGDRYGFLLLHHTGEILWSLMYTWVDGCLLHLKVASLDLSSPDQVHVPLEDPLVGCVWQLPLITHERDSWVHHVVTPTAPRHDAYLADRFTGVVCGG